MAESIAFVACERRQLSLAQGSTRGVLRTARREGEGEEEEEEGKGAEWVGLALDMEIESWKGRRV